MKDKKKKRNKVVFSKHSTFCESSYLCTNFKCLFNEGKKEPKLKVKIVSSSPFPGANITITCLDWE
jgi:hypothetical protein